MNLPVHGPFATLPTDLQAALTGIGVAPTDEVLIFHFAAGNTTKLLEAAAVVAVEDGPGIAQAFATHNILTEFFAVMKAAADEKLAESGL